MRARFALLLVAASCAAPHPETGQTEAASQSDTVCRDLRGARMQVLAQDRVASALAGALGYVRGLLPQFDDGVVLLVPGRPILEGKAAAAAYYGSLDPADRLVWQPTRIDAAVDGTFGTSWGWTTTTGVAADGTPTTRYGRNIIVWRRGTGGWRIAVYLQSNAGAPSGPPPDGFGLFPDGDVRCSRFVDPAAETAVLEATDDQFAALSVATNFAIAFQAYAAPDGAVRSGPNIIVGPEAIGAFYAQFVDPNETLDWGAALGDVARSGDLGWTVGNAIDTVRDPAGDLVFYSKYLTVWQKQPDGNWRYVIDGGNSAPAP